MAASSAEAESGHFVDEVRFQLEILLGVSHILLRRPSHFPTSSFARRSRPPLEGAACSYCHRSPPLPKIDGLDLALQSSCIM